jgi:hypothetical protein
MKHEYDIVISEPQIPAASSAGESKVGVPPGNFPGGHYGVGRDSWYMRSILQSARSSTIVMICRNYAVHDRSKHSPPRLISLLSYWLKATVAVATKKE